jgi:glycosyltransferase involved in cell wall biosynthesis
VPEVVAHGVTGWICDEPEELPQALHRCGELDAAACVARVRERFSADVMARGYERLYRKVIAAQRGRLIPRIRSAADGHADVVAAPRV